MGRGAGTTENVQLRRQSVIRLRVQTWGVSLFLWKQIFLQFCTLVCKSPVRVLFTSSHCGNGNWVWRWRPCGDKKEFILIIKNRPNVGKYQGLFQMSILYFLHFCWLQMPQTVYRTFLLKEISLIFVYL